MCVCNPLIRTPFCNSDICIAAKKEWEELANFFIKFSEDMDKKINEPATTIQKEDCPTCSGTGKVFNRSLGDYCPSPKPCLACKGDKNEND